MSTVDGENKGECVPLVNDYPPQLDQPILTELESEKTSNRKEGVVIVTWNIERGLALEKIQKELLELAPDIVLLQEVDVGRRKTGRKDIAKEIAEALGLNFVLFGTEFKMKVGNHGNAILSRFPITAHYIIRLPLYFQWRGRKGGRMGLVALVDTGDIWGEIVCVSTHLENKCTPADRRNQFTYLIDTLLCNETITMTEETKVIIGGDMNTIATKMAKFYDMRMGGNDIWDRVRNLGYSEAKTWEYLMPEYVGENGRFQDPFDKNNDVTFHVQKYVTWYSAKLDWLLFSNCHPIESKQIGGNTEGIKGERSSDHHWLCVSFAVGPNA